MKSCALHSENVTLAYTDIKVPDQPFALYSLAPRLLIFFSYSTQLSMKFVLLINLKLLKITISYLLNVSEYENFSANEYENAN